MNNQRQAIDTGSATSVLGSAAAKPVPQGVPGRFAGLLAGLRGASFALALALFPALAAEAQTVNLSQTGQVTISENGGSASWTVVLSQQPSDRVNVNVKSSDKSTATVYTASPNYVRFTTENWNVPQTVTVNAVNDSGVNAGNARNAAITHTARTNDKSFNLYTVTVNVRVVDDEVASVANSFLSTIIVPGRHATSPGYFDTGIGSASHGALSGIPDGYTLQALYSRSSNPSRTIIEFKDSSGIRSLLPESLGPFVVQLGSGPFATRYRVESGTSSYWFDGLTLTEGEIYEFHLLTVTPQNVSVRSGNGRLVVSWEGVDIASSHQVRYRKPQEIAVPRDQWTWTEFPGNETTPWVISNLLNQHHYYVQVGAVVDGHTHWPTEYIIGTPWWRDLQFSQPDMGDGWSYALFENGGKVTYYVKLSHAPTADVSVTLTPTTTAPATVSRSSLTFTTGNWHVGQTVTITGIDDDIQNPDNKRSLGVVHTAKSADPDWQNETKTQNFTIADNEIATVADSFLSTIVVSGRTTTYYSYGRQVGYSLYAGAVSNQRPSKILNSNWRLAALYDESRNPGRPLLVFSGPGKGSSQTDPGKPYSGSCCFFQHLPTSFGPFLVQLGSGASATRWLPTAGKGRYSSGTPHHELPQGSLTIEDSGVYEIHLIAAAPQQPRVVPGNEMLTISWSDVDVATAHHVRYKKSSETTWTDFTGSETGPYTITGLTNDISYDVQVGAVIDGTTHWANPLQTIPALREIVLSGMTPDVFPASIGRVVFENGDTETFTLQFTKAPTVNVSLVLTSSNPSAATVSPTALVLNAQNWNTPHTVTVTGVDDSTSNPGNRRDVPTSPATPASRAPGAAAERRNTITNQASRPTSSSTPSRTPSTP